MLVGYARTSTGDQIYGLEAQLRKLKAGGCEKIFQEYASTRGERPKLTDALDFVREGDTLVAVRLDRIARSTKELLEISDRLKAKSVALKVLDQSIDTSTPYGELIFTMIGAIAQFERDIMLERQREGIAEAKARGKYKGRKPTAREKADQVLAMNAERIRPTDIARQLGISRSSVYRILDDAAEQES
jgi:DNA invertase Pin-like site-specific DNA recombinase